MTRGETVDLMSFRSAPLIIRKRFRCTGPSTEVFYCVSDFPNWWVLAKVLMNYRDERQQRTLSFSSRQLFIPFELLQDSDSTGIDGRDDRSRC